LLQPVGAIRGGGSNAQTWNRGREGKTMEWIEMMEKGRFNRKENNYERWIEKGSDREAERKSEREKQKNR
jgi:hypothetical protein